MHFAYMTCIACQKYILRARHDMLHVGQCILRARQSILRARQCILRARHAYNAFCMPDKAYCVPDNSFCVLDIHSTCRAMHFPCLTMRWAGQTKCSACWTHHFECRTEHLGDPKATLDLLQPCQQRRRDPRTAQTLILWTVPRFCRVLSVGRQGRRGSCSESKFRKPESRQGVTAIFLDRYIIYINH